MAKVNVSYSVSAADVAAVITALETIQSKLPFLIRLTKEERIEIIKMGNKSVDFVQEAASVAKSYPQILPFNFDKVEFQKDAELIKVLSDLRFRVDSLSDMLRDTLMEVGSEAMILALQIYAQAQLQKNTPGLESVADRLHDRFKRKKRKSDKVEVKLE
jgi:hypothetical protein